MRFLIFSRFTLFGRRWYFHARGRNGEIILQSEAYRNHADCISSVHLIRAKAASAAIDDLEWSKTQQASQ